MASPASPTQKSSVRASALERVGFSVAAVAAIGLSMLLVSTFDYGRDQGIYALVARETLAGGAPYRDAFDFKPPGIFAVYALARGLFGPSMAGVRVLEVLAMAVSAWALVRLARRHLGGAAVGLLAAVIASQIHAQLDFWHTAQPETFGGTLTLLGLVSHARAQDATRAGARRWLVLCGALFGLAGLMKPPLAGVGALVGIVHGLAAWRTARAEGRRPDVRLVLERVALVAVGGALPFALTAAWFASKGALGDLHQVLFVFTPHYTKISWQGASVSAMAYYGVAEWLTTYSSALLLGFVCLAVTVHRSPGKGFLLLVLGAIGVHIAGIVMQAKFFQYHWGATFPLSALLAATGLVRVHELARERSRWLGGAFALAALAIATVKMPVPSFGDTFFARSEQRLALLGSGDRRSWDALASVADVDAAQNRAVAQFLREHTEAGDAVFVWGFEPVIYDLADRPLASRYIYNVPQRATWSSGPMQETLMRDLGAAPPKAIVVEHGDVFPFVTGNNLDSARSLEHFPALAELLRERYRPVSDIGDFEVYLLIEPAD